MAKIIILYSTLGGGTRAAAEHVAAGVRLAPGAEPTLMDAAELDMAAIDAADAVAIGSPNYYSYPSGLVKHFFDLALNRAAMKGKRFAAFSTHGGGGGVSGTIEKLAQAAGMKAAAPSVDCAGTPKGDDVKALRKLGQTLAAQASA